jgi:hypothetical protein
MLDGFSAYGSRACAMASPARQQQHQDTRPFYHGAQRDALYGSSLSLHLTPRAAGAAASAPSPTGVDGFAPRAPAAESTPASNSPSKIAMELAVKEECYRRLAEEGLLKLQQSRERFGLDDQGYVGGEQADGCGPVHHKRHYERRSDFTFDSPEEVRSSPPARPLPMSPLPVSPTLPTTTESVRGVRAATHAAGAAMQYGTSHRFEKWEARPEAHAPFGVSSADEEPTNPIPHCDQPQMPAGMPASRTRGPATSRFFEGEPVRSPARETYDRTSLCLAWEGLNTQEDRRDLEAPFAPEQPGDDVVLEDMDEQDTEDTAPTEEQPAQELPAQEQSSHEPDASIDAVRSRVHEASSPPYSDRFARAQARKSFLEEHGCGGIRTDASSGDRQQQEGAVRVQPWDQQRMFEERALQEHQRREAWAREVDAQRQLASPGRAQPDSDARSIYHACSQVCEERHVPNPPNQHHYHHPALGAVRHELQASDERTTSRQLHVTDRNGRRTIVPASEPTVEAAATQSPSHVSARATQQYWRQPLHLDQRLSHRRMVAGQAFKNRTAAQSSFQLADFGGV